MKNNTNSLVKKCAAVTITTLLAGVLASCGGGGSSTQACSSSSSFSLTSSWAITGGVIGNNSLVTPNFYGFVGIPFVATPTVSGAPASCVGQQGFATSGTLPAGLTLNNSTGVVSGTATQPGSISAINIAYPGYNASAISGAVQFSTPITAVAGQTFTLSVGSAAWVPSGTTVTNSSTNVTTKVNGDNNKIIVSAGVLSTSGSVTVVVPVSSTGLADNLVMVGR